MIKDIKNFLCKFKTFERLFNSLEYEYTFVDYNTNCKNYFTDLNINISNEKIGNSFLIFIKNGLGDMEMIDIFDYINIKYIFDKDHMHLYKDIHNMCMYILSREYDINEYLNITLENTKFNMEISTERKIPIINKYRVICSIKLTRKTAKKLSEMLHSLVSIYLYYEDRYIDDSNLDILEKKLDKFTKVDRMNKDFIHIAFEPENIDALYDRYFRLYYDNKSKSFVLDKFYEELDENTNEVFMSWSMYNKVYAQLHHNSMKSIFKDIQDKVSV